jgi:16S rRNA (guanine527-N7)-methyltransferase
MGISMTDSKLAELERLISSWPGLMAQADRALIDDSLVLVDHLGAARSLVDVGSGAGLPGLPIKIARPDLRVTLIEADQAKAAFLVHASAALGLEGVEVVARRAEDAGQDPALREAFDVAVARALAPLPVLVELCLPLVRVGGRLLAQKTEGEDPAGASTAIDLLGGRLGAVVSAPSPARTAGTIVVVDKVAPTPARYPRRPGAPARKPLRN